MIVHGCDNVIESIGSVPILPAFCSVSMALCSGCVCHTFWAREPGHRIRHVRSEVIFFDGNTTSDLISLLPLGSRALRSYDICFSCFCLARLFRRRGRGRGPVRARLERLCLHRGPGCLRGRLALGSGLGIAYLEEGQGVC